VSSSIFLDLAFPTSTTWFYCSFLLAITLFFRFDRVFSLRHSDILGLYLMIPGLLCIQEAHAIKNLIAVEQLEQLSRLIKRSNGLLLAGYIWLISGSLVWFLRCQFDLGLEKRPMLPPNLNMAGMVFLLLVLFGCLTYTAFRQLPDAEPQWGHGPIALTKAKDGALAIVSFQSGRADWELTDTRFWVERSVVILAHFLVAIGRITFKDTLTGVAMAVLYLLLPCTWYQVSQLHHIWPTIFLLTAVLWYQKPLIAGALLGLASGSVFFPILLFPLWVGFYRGRGTGRFCIGFLEFRVNRHSIDLERTATTILANRLKPIRLASVESPQDREYLAREPLGLSVTRVCDIHGLYRVDDFLAKSPEFGACDCTIGSSRDWRAILVCRPRRGLHALVHALIVVDGVSPKRRPHSPTGTKPTISPLS
jgi:hypothetical protein